MILRVDKEWLWFNFVKNGKMRKIIFLGFVIILLGSCLRQDRLMPYVYVMPTLAEDTVQAGDTLIFDLEILPFNGASVGETRIYFDDSLVFLHNYNSADTVKDNIQVQVSSTITDTVWIKLTVGARPVSEDIWDLKYSFFMAIP